MSAAVFLAGAGVVVRAAVGAGEIVGPAPPGRALDVARREIAPAGHPCPRVVRAARSADGSISAACSNGERYRIITLGPAGQHAIVVVLQCSIVGQLGAQAC